MLQLLLFSGLAFATLQRTGLYPPELRSTVLDFDFFYRKAGKAAAKAIIEALSRGRAKVEGQARRSLDVWIERVFHLHGPQSVLARTWQTGSTVLCVTILFAVVLLVSYLGD